MAKDKVDLDREAKKIVITAIDELDLLRCGSSERYLNYAPEVLRMIIDYCDNFCDWSLT